MKTLLDRDRWAEVFETLLRNKRRSITTSFGIFWGLFILVVLLSISQAFRAGMQANTAALSKNVIYAWPMTTSKPYEGLPVGRRFNFKASDIERLRAELPQIERVLANRVLWGWSDSDGGDIVYQSRSTSASVNGVNSDYFDVMHVDVLSGRMLDSRDYQGRQKVCILGKDIADKLSPGKPSALVGERIKVKGIVFTVVGVIRDKSEGISTGFARPNEDIYITLSTLDLLDNKHNEVYNLGIVFSPEVSASQMVPRLKTVLKQIYKIHPDDDKAIGVFDSEIIFQVFGAMGIGVYILVWIVGLGTLFSGIVSISNILLVTVRERTQEIGVRRALGATPRDIVSQLLLESLTITGISGLLGLMCGVGLMALVAKLPMFSDDGSAAIFSSSDITISLPLSLVILLIILLSGVLSAILPALRAIEIKAIEAIREE